MMGLELKPKEAQHKASILCTTECDIACSGNNTNTEKGCGRMTQSQIKTLEVKINLNFILSKQEDTGRS